MRLYCGEVPRTEETSPEAQDWRVIRSPSSELGFGLAMLAGLVLLSGQCLALGLFLMKIGDAGLAVAGDSPLSWVVALVVLVVYIPLHEWLHLLGQPGWGYSDQSVVVVWPAKLRFGVYYEGCMSRRRWLGMRLAPWIALSVLPMGLLALLQVQPLGPELEIGLCVLMVVNTLGSGADVVAALLVLTQVPASGQLCFQGGRAYWRSA
jgi:hypothetical protein